MQRQPQNDSAPSTFVKVCMGIGLTGSLLIFPLAIGLYIALLSHDDLPFIGTAVGIIFGICIAIGISVQGISLWRRSRWQKFMLMLIIIGVFDVAWLPIGWGISFINRPYRRQDLAFPSVQVPTVNISGMWSGTWHDPKQAFTERITLILLQNGNAVTGTITSERGRKFDIVEGVVSENRLNIYYNVSWPEWPGAGGSLLGEVQDTNIMGTWYALERPLEGWSRDGPWSASFTGKAIE